MELTQEHFDQAVKGLATQQSVDELTGRLDDDQKRRLVEIAERCPVHRTLKSEINIRTSLAA